MAVHSQHIQLVADHERADTLLRGKLRSETPCYISRIGGSDFDAVVEYFKNLESFDEAEAGLSVSEKWNTVKKYNGFYDRAEDPKNLHKFCNLFIDSFKNCDHTFMCGAYLLSEFLPGSINPVFRVDTSESSLWINRFLHTISRKFYPSRYYPYSYVESMVRGNHTLFRAFSDILPGKRVLAVTPFRDSILDNFSNRFQFFRDYKYPDFDLEAYNTPITYEGLPSSYYPDDNWFDTLDRMKREVSEIEFDVALLSCGSYALPLGLHIRDTLKRKAIYVGGCLQIYFGIMGRRYMNPWFMDQINVEKFIEPLEKDRYIQHFSITDDTAREAFGAYF